MIADRPGHISAGSHRCGSDDEIGIGHSIGDVGMHAVDKPQRRRPLTNICVGIMSRNMTRKSVYTCRMRERGPDQANTDYCDPFKQWGLAHDAPTKARKAATTSSISSRVPIDIRTQSGKP